MTIEERLKRLEDKLDIKDPTKKGRSVILKGTWCRFWNDVDDDDVDEEISKYACELDTSFIGNFGDINGESWDNCEPLPGQWIGWEAGEDNTPPINWDQDVFIKQKRDFNINCKASTANWDLRGDATTIAYLVIPKYEPST